MTFFFVPTSLQHCAYTGHGASAGAVPDSGQELDALLKFFYPQQLFCDVGIV